MDWNNLIPSMESSADAKPAPKPKATRAAPPSVQPAPKPKAKAARPVAQATPEIEETGDDPLPEFDTDGRPNRDPAPGMEYQKEHFWHEVRDGGKKYSRGALEAAFLELTGELPKMIFDARGHTYIGPVERNGGQ